MRKKAPLVAAAPNAAPPAEEFACQWCGAAFSKERTLLAHSCERRRRFVARGDRDASLGFASYVQTMHSWRRPVPTQDDFERSQFYLAFVRFGRWLLNIEAISPTRFLDFLLATGVPVDRWCERGVYETYLRELNKTETPDAAAERTVLLMRSWAMQPVPPGAPPRAWEDFFRRIEPARAVMWIANGRISPWALYTAPSAEDLLNRLSPEQIDLVSKALDPAFWEKRLADHPQEVARLRNIFADFGA